MSLTDDDDDDGTPIARSHQLMSTLAAKGRGGKRSSLRGRFHPAPLFYHGSIPGDFPKEYPLSSIQRYYLSGRPQKPIYLDQVNTYIHIPRPPHPSLRKEEDQRTIITNDRSIHAQKAYLPSTSPIKVHPNPTQSKSKSCSPPSPSSSSSSSSPPSSPPPKNSP